MMKVLSPGMEHRQKADLGAQVQGVSRDLQQGLRRGPEQDAVNHPLIVERHVSERLG